MNITISDEDIGHTVCVATVSSAYSAVVVIVLLYMMAGVAGKQEEFDDRAGWSLWSALNNILKQTD